MGLLASQARLRDTLRESARYRIFAGGAVRVVAVGCAGPGADSWGRGCGARFHDRFVAVGVRAEVATILAVVTFLRTCWNARVTSGYSGTSQARKLGVRDGCRLVLDAAPQGWALTDPPPVVTVPPGESADVIVTFVRTVADLPARVDALSERIRPNGALWIAWPRRAAGHVSDMTENAIRECVLPLGLVDVKVAAIDKDWSGLKIVWRKERRRS